MDINLEDLQQNTKEHVKIGNLNTFRESENDLYQTIHKNQLNDLTLYEWIRHTNSFHSFNKKVFKDLQKSKHPATFEEELPYYYIEFFSKEKDLIFDPFVGTGTTNIASSLLGRRSIGIEINKQFFDLALFRLKKNDLDQENHKILNGDCYTLLKNGEFNSILKEMNDKIGFTITSPPYFNILKNYINKKNENFRFATNYGRNPKNLENIKDYREFLNILVIIFNEIYKFMKNKSYLVINVQNFYRKVQYKGGTLGQEIVFFAWDLAKKLSKTNWIPCGEQIWAYPNKSLFPFGSPYVYLANITHSYNLIFHKNTTKK